MKYEETPESCGIHIFKVETMDLFYELDKCKYCGVPNPLVEQQLKKVRV